MLLYRLWKTFLFLPTYCRVPFNSQQVFEAAEHPDTLLETLSNADNKISNLEQSLNEFSGRHDEREELSDILHRCI